MELQRVNQCNKCPWKVSTDPFDIPDGYCETKHANLKNTIAKEGSLEFLSKGLNVMACHHSNGNDEMFCVGWLHNQLGAGNNIGLRIKMMNYTNVGKIKVYGKQHKKFEDTLPKPKRKEQI